MVTAYNSKSLLVLTVCFFAFPEKFVNPVEGYPHLIRAPSNNTESLEDLLHHGETWDQRGRLRALYVKYEAELTRVRSEIENFCLSDIKPACISTYIEMEISYMRMREAKPRIIIEASPNHGFSTYWILKALMANGSGKLLSFDTMAPPKFPNLLTHAVGNSSVEYKHVLGDIRKTFTVEVPPGTAELVDYVYIDMAHDKGLAEWYTKNILTFFTKFPSKKIWVSVHDVFNHWYPLCSGKDAHFDDPTVEGLVVMEWIVFHSKTVENVFQWTKWKHNGVRIKSLNSVRAQTLDYSCKELAGIGNMRFWCDALTLWFQLQT